MFHIAFHIPDDFIHSAADACTSYGINAFTRMTWHCSPPVLSHGPIGQSPTGKYLADAEGPILAIQASILSCIPSGVSARVSSQMVVTRLGSGTDTCNRKPVHTAKGQSIGCERVDNQNPQLHHQVPLDLATTKENPGLQGYRAATHKGESLPKKAQYMRQLVPLGSRICRGGKKCVPCVSEATGKTYFR